MKPFGLLSLARVALGLYLAVVLARLLPWAEDLYGQRGVLGDVTLSPLHGVLPAALHRLGRRAGRLRGGPGRPGAGPGRRPVPAGGRRPPLGRVGPALAPQRLHPEPRGALPGLPAARRGGHPGPRRHAAGRLARRHHRAGGRVPHGRGSPSSTARAGAATKRLASSSAVRSPATCPGWPPSRRPPRSRRSSPGAPWPSSCSPCRSRPPRLRPWSWLSLVGLHLGILASVQFAELTLGMLVVHLFAFDPAWLPRRRRAAVAAAAC
ncbi:MAG: hypothetical protein R3F43_12660 [bacterium]